MGKRLNTQADTPCFHRQIIAYSLSGVSGSAFTIPFTKRDQDIVGLPLCVNSNAHLRITVTSASNAAWTGRSVDTPHLRE